MGFITLLMTASGFYVDSTRKDHKTNVDFIISGDRIIEQNGTYINKPFKVQKIKEVSVITDYSFLKKEALIKIQSPMMGFSLSRMTK